MNPAMLSTLVASALINTRDLPCSVFDKIVEALRKSNKTKEEIENETPAFGTHRHILHTASTLTHGDILEFGCGMFSTPKLHEVTTASQSTRMLVSAETDMLWLRQLIHRFCHF